MLHSDRKECEAEGDEEARQPEVGQEFGQLHDPGRARTLSVVHLLKTYFPLKIVSLEAGVELKIKMAWPEILHQKHIFDQ